MRERVLRFGPGENLVGILTEPSPNRLVTQAPIAVLLNAGIVHRVGPFRLNVELARALAAVGVRTLRIDLSGLGDSENRSDAVNSIERAIRDTQAAFEKLELLTSIRQFVLFGLCSGSHYAHQVCLADDRVVGAAFMDGYAFTTPQHRSRRIRSKLRYRFLRNAIKRRLLRLKLEEASTISQNGSTVPVEFFEHNNQDRLRVVAELQSMLNRQVRLKFVFTGGHPDFSSTEQLEEMYGMQANEHNVSLDYFPLAEHTFPVAESRRLLLTSLVEWYSNGFCNCAPVRNHEPCNMDDSTSNLRKQVGELPIEIKQSSLSIADIAADSPWSLPLSPLALPPEQQSTGSA